MIKKLILGLGLFVFGSLGFTNAIFQYFSIGLEKTPSYWENQYDVGILKKGRFLTNYLGTSKALLGLNQKYFTFWNDGGLYLYYSGSSSFGIIQGYFQYYMACDEILYDSTGDALTGCSSSQLFNFKNDEIVSNFISSLNNGDIVYVEDKISHNGCGGYCTFDRYNIKVCFSSSSVGSTMCFVGDKSTYESSSYGSKTPFLRASLLTGRSNFSNISSTLLSEPPGFSNNIEGGSSIGNNVSLTGNLMYDNSCTNGYVVSQLEKDGYSSNLCYAGVVFNSGAIIESDGTYLFELGYGTDYKELYRLTSDGMGWNKRFKTYLYDMRMWKFGQYGYNPFQGKPVALYTYFQILSSSVDGVNNGYDVLNYCNLKLYSELNSPYKGNYFSSYCSNFNSSSSSPDYTTGEIGDIDDDEILPPGFDVGNDDHTSSGVVVSVDWSGTLSGETNKNFDGKNFINDFYQKLQSVYQKPLNSSTGIIPGYILVFLVAIILFRFISH